MTSLKVDEERFWAKVDKSGDCWIWTAYTNSLGYGVFGTKTTEGWKNQKAHRVSFYLTNNYLPNRAKKRIVAHHCGVRSCVNPDHLYDASYKDNEVDKDKHGTRGIKLNNADVEVIRNMLKIGVTQQEIADHFDVSQSLISRIKTKRAWSPLEH